MLTCDASYATDRLRDPSCPDCLSAASRDALVVFPHSRLGEDAGRATSPRAAADVAAHLRIIVTSVLRSVPFAVDR